MISFMCTVEDEHGIHARPAGVIVNCAKKFESDITVKKDGREANGKRLLSVMGLGARYGEVLEFRIDGRDEAEAARELERVCREELG